MATIRITIEEEDMDNKFRKMLAERQSNGLLTVERVEITRYKVMPPNKRGKLQRMKPKPEDFVKAVKFIVKHAAQRNNEVKYIIENGKTEKYCFWLDSECFCNVMDKLLAEHRDVITAALEHKYQADSVNLLAPFLGEIIGHGLFQKTKIQKTDLINSFSAYYGKPKPSVQTKLSTSYPAWSEFNDLVGETFKIAKNKHK